MPGHEELHEEQRLHGFLLAGGGGGANVRTPFGRYGVDGTLSYKHPSWMYRLNDTALPSDRSPTVDLTLSAFRLSEYHDYKKGGVNLEYCPNPASNT
jgi:hypothetical protein